MKMEKKLLSDFTENEFLDFVTGICKDTYKTEGEHILAVLAFEKLTEHPAGSDLIYYPENGADNTPEGIIKTIKKWRTDEGKSGFNVK
ncbi:bacteriocin immunity protein [Cronobacter malonaticus]|nr:bacteriocin immunity protein [Cronobacter malonaticus]EKY3231574.1 bacteriocin immunity protein [Cronobacter malonaticus]ELY4025255.1 bacteriocin immunity protein [Cronobacter malonaticus]MDI7684349.1 bacteriocin immunity protein [Cronobacter malonaticus]